jgi:armadillo repeat-containing protein 8
MYQRNQSIYQCRRLIQALTRLPYVESEPQGSQDDVRTEAAHIISSLSYGPPESLEGLLQHNAVPALLQAVRSFSPFEKPSVKGAFARALKTVGGALADIYGPLQWGLPHENTQLRLHAKNALDIFFEVHHSYFEGLRIRL